MRAAVFIAARCCACLDIICARFKQKQRLGCAQFKAEVYTLPHQCLSKLHTSALNCVHPSRCFCLNRAHMESRFRAKVMKTNKDSMTRQVREGVMIRRTRRVMMNSRSEWFQPPIYRIRSEVVQE